MANRRFLLLQVRNPDDPMREHEVTCFANALSCPRESIGVHDLLHSIPSAARIAPFDALLFGGSGDYSAAAMGDAWLDRTLPGLKDLSETGKPIFASCWGFQAMARALGGRCISDPANAELGTIEIELTEEGERDPVFSFLPKRFLAQAGHMDHVVQLPPGAIRLAASNQVLNQAFAVADRPIYCTQFHPELDRDGLIARLETYPSYVERISHLPFALFKKSHCHATPECNALLARFVDVFLR